MKNKLMATLAALLVSVVLLLSLSSCGMFGNNTEEPTSTPEKDDIKDNIKDDANDIKDGIKDGADDVKDGIENILPDPERGKQTGDRGDAFTSDERSFSHNSVRSFGK